MSTLQTPDSFVRKAIRLWPGVAIVAIQWILRFIVPAVYADGILIGLLGAMAGGLGILIWWLFFSRARMARSHRRPGRHSCRLSRDKTSA